MSIIYVVGCGASKAPTPRPLRDLYTGPLFRAARDHVERTGAPWWVLSAEHGLIDPHAVAAPYDRTIAQAQTDDQFGMGLCLGAFGRRLGFPGAVTVEVHAGAAYVEWLREIIAQAPLTHHTGKRLVVTVEEPLRGLEIGQRLGWYKARRIAVETQTRLWESGQLTARA